MTSIPSTNAVDRNALIEHAARWLSEQLPSPRPVPELRERFGLTTTESCAAIGRANRMRMLRSAMS